MYVCLCMFLRAYVCLYALALGSPTFNVGSWNVNIGVCKIFTKNDFSDLKKAHTFFMELPPFSMFVNYLDLKVMSVVRFYYLILEHCWDYSRYDTLCLFLKLCAVKLRITIIFIWKFYCDKVIDKSVILLMLAIKKCHYCTS